MVLSQKKHIDNYIHFFNICLVEYWKEHSDEVK